jgi:hypothetical protein
METILVIFGVGIRRPIKKDNGLNRNKIKGKRKYRTGEEDLEQQN